METWNGLISPFHFAHLEVWIQMNLMPWKTCFTSKSKMSLWRWLTQICFETDILDAKYEKTDVAEVMKGLIHLNAHQKADLLWVLQENEKMFDETLDVYSHKRVHIDIDLNAKYVHSMPYPVPEIHLKTFKKKFDHLVGLGVLAPQQESEWASSSFAIPKKDNRVRWISDSCQLNKVRRRKQYPLPIITDILRKRSGYKFLLNLMLVCNTIRLSLTTKIKTPVLSSHHLVNIRTWDSQWDSNALQTLLKQLWKIYYQIINEFIQNEFIYI